MAVKVHQGFLQLYNAFAAALRRDIAADDPGRVFVAGHSLGGALATLAALDIRLAQPNARASSSLMTLPNAPPVVKGVPPYG